MSLSRHGASLFMLTLSLRYAPPRRLVVSVAGTSATNLSKPSGLLPTQTILSNAYMFSFRSARTRSIQLLTLTTCTRRLLHTYHGILGSQGTTQDTTRGPRRNGTQWFAGHHPTCNVCCCRHLRHLRHFLRQMLRVLDSSSRSLHDAADVAKPSESWSPGSLHDAAGAANLFVATAAAAARATWAAVLEFRSPAAAAAASQHQLLADGPTEAAAKQSQPLGCTGRNWAELGGTGLNRADHKHNTTQSQPKHNTT